MKSTTMIGVIMAFAVAGLVLTTASPAGAVAGCCKQRDAGNGQWRITQLSLSDCKKQNVADGDKIIKPSGRVWWDIAC